MAAASLQQLEQSAWVGLVSLLFLFGNIGLTVYSHLEVSAFVLTNVAPADLATLGAGSGDSTDAPTVAPTRAPTIAEWTTVDWKVCADEGQSCVCDGTIFYGRKLSLTRTSQNLTEPANRTTLAEVLAEGKFIQKPSRAAAWTCNNDTLGEVLGGVQKHCICKSGLYLLDWPPPPPPDPCNPAEKAAATAYVPIPGAKGPSCNPDDDDYTVGTQCNLLDRVLFEEIDCADGMVTKVIGWDLACFGNITAECVGGKAVKDGFSEACGPCLGVVGVCAFQTCAIQCLSGYSEVCKNCLLDDCLPTFVTCSAFPGFGPPLPPVDDNASVTTAPPTPAPVVEDKYYVVQDHGEISFGDTLLRAWQGGAKLLAAVIFICSGIEPYLESVLMCIAWFVPMSPKWRRKMLESLSWFGRWSLVDVYAVLVLVIVVKGDFAGTLKLIATSGPAVAAFAFQNQWALMQGEWMLHRHHLTLKKHGIEEEKPPPKGCFARLHSNNYFMLLLALTVLVTTAIGLFTICAEFEMYTVSEGPGSGLYIRWFMFGISINDVPSAFCILRACVLPLLVGVGCLALYLYVVVTKAAMAGRLLTIRHTLRLLAHFCALDVMMLAVLLLANEYDLLISSVAYAIDKCFIMGASAKLEMGGICCLVGSVLSWSLTWGMGLPVDDSNQVQPTNEELAGSEPKPSLT